MDGYLRLLGIIIGVFLFDLIVMRRILAPRLKEFTIYKWRILVYVILFVVFIGPLTRVLFHANPSPSPVDASLIAQLTSEQIEAWRFATVLDSLQDNENIRRFERNDFPNQVNWELSYRFTYVCEYGAVVIRIQFYRYEQRLIDRLPFYSRQYALRGSTVISNENNTQAFLHASFMPRSHGFTVDHRSIWTELRFNNVHITLAEQRSHRDLYPNASSDFIRLLYELLTAEE